MPDEKIISTDVLVIGGGIAGIFAAVKAREQGVDVTLVSKGNIGRSGQSPWAHGTMVIPPDSGSLPDELMEKARVGGEYLNNRDWTGRVIKDSFDRFQDFLSWDRPFRKDEKGEYIRPIMFGKEEPGRLWGKADGPLSWIKPLKNLLQEKDVQVLEKIMIVELIKQDEKILGAVGISTTSMDLHIFKAGATVLCTGSGGFKPVGGWPIGDLTADGHVMGYKAGAAITGKEFEDIHNGMNRRKGNLLLGLDPSIPFVSADGNEIEIRNVFGLGLDFVAHMGNAPVHRGEDEVLSGVSPGMSVHTAEGVWPVDGNCSSGVPGLYAAGDSCGTMVTGAVYSLGGSGTATASVTGTRAGLAAARYAKESGTSTINEQELAQLKKEVMMPATRKGGFSPNWVTQLLQSITVPYFMQRIKHGARMQAALTLIEFMRDELSPKLYARDPHELRLAHETRNMIINAEMRLRASLFRTESRGTHYREDYPRRSDPDWLAWVLLKEEDGRMKAIKKPIPEEWRPDLSVPYEQRYPNRFPGE